MRTFSIHEISTAPFRVGVSVLNILPRFLKTVFNVLIFFHTNQILCYSVNPIYDLQATYVLNIMTIDKNSPLPTFYSMKYHRDNGDNTVCITEVGIKR